MEIFGMVGGIKHGETEADCSKPCLWLQGGTCRLTGAEAECAVRAAEQGASIHPGHAGKKRRYAPYRFWEPWEEQMLLDGKSAEEVSAATGRSVDTVKAKGRALGIKMTGQSYKAWSDEEIAAVRDDMSPHADVARRLGRTTNAVKKMRQKLGIRI